MKYFVTVDGTGTPVSLSQFYSDEITPNTLNTYLLPNNTEISFEELISSWRLTNAGILEKVGPPPTVWHIWDPKNNAWLEDIGRAKLEKRAELQKLRNTLEFGGFTWNSYTFDSDMISQQRLNQACQQALLANMTNSSFSRNWTLSNGEVLENVTAEQMLEICRTLADHVNSLHTRSQELYKKIDLATTLEEVAAVTWS